MSSQKRPSAKPKVAKENAVTRAELFNSLASAYDDWYQGEGKLIFAIEVRAFQEVLASLPGPWLEIGVGSRRFAHALGIGTGVDPSILRLDL